MDEPKPVGDLGVSDVILGATILPIYVGGVNSLGQEPISDPAYTRGTIKWDVMPNQEIVGRARVPVPAGTWRWLIYTFHPTSAGFIFAEKLGTDIVLASPGYLDLDCLNSSGIFHRPGVLPD